MNLFKLTEVAPLTSDRVGHFKGEMSYVATGSVDDKQNITAEKVTFSSRPSRADLVVKEKDVCFARMQNTSKVFLVNKDNVGFIYSTGFAILRPNQEKIDPKFLFHLVKSSYFQSLKDSLCSGATQKAITNEKLNSITVKLPALDEQRFIAATLDKVDLLVLKREQTIDMIETLSKNIFLDMFGDPSVNPKKWDEEFLTNFFKFKTGKLDSNAAVQDGKYPFFTCSRDNFLINDYAFDEEALLLSGNNASADYSVKHYVGKFNAYQRTYVINLEDPTCSYYYSKTALELKLADMKRFSKGSNTKYLTMGIFRNMKIAKPPVKLQAEYERKIKKLDEVKKLILGSMEKISSLDKSLSHKLLSNLYE